MNEPKRVLVANQYTLKSTEIMGKTLYQWRGNDGRGYSPKFTDPIKAVKYPSQNNLKSNPKYDVYP